VKLLTKMSESTADSNRLSFAVGEVFGRLPWEAFQKRLPCGERGFRNPGLFDK
jgi:hypothetical protein